MLMSGECEAARLLLQEWCVVHDVEGSCGRFGEASEYGDCSDVRVKVDRCWLDDVGM